MNASAVVGTGYWGKKHAEEYAKLGLDVYAVDTSRDALESCESFTKGQYTSIDEMCKNPDIRYVSVCTPNDTHYEVTKKLLENDKHVLVEKPFVMTDPQGRELIKLAKEKQLTLAVGHIFRFNNAINFIKNRIDIFGKPRIVKLAWTNVEPIYNDRDILYDLATHPYDILLYLFDMEISNVFCIAQKWRQEQPESAFINFMMNGVLVDIEVSWVTPRKTRSLTIVGSDATAFVDCVKQTVNIYHNETKSIEPIDIVPNNTIQDELRAFINCVETRGTSVADAEVGMKVVRLLEASKQSMETGQRQEVAN